MDNLTGRKLRNDGPVENVPAEAIEQSPAARGASVFSKFKPYLGSASVPSLKDGEKRSEARYEIVRSGKRFKLLRYRRGSYGMHREVARILEPGNKNKPQDKAFMAGLKKAGIPGAN